MFAKGEAPTGASPFVLAPSKIDTQETMKSFISFRVLSMALLLLGVGGFALGGFSLESQLKPDSAQQTLVESSKKAIVSTGISESYFNSHFTLLKVFNQPSDRRVMWKFAVNGYEAIINDSIGSTVVDSKEINIHSVSRSLGQVKEITKTISKSRALKALKTCVGNYSEPYVEFGQVEGHAELFLVGTQKPKVNRREQADSLEREREEAEERSRTIGTTDVIENEEGEKQKSPVIIGYINLQTGKCTRGKGILAKESL
jgi:hypothetical protein